MAGFHLVTGLMGAGKTYYGVELIRAALAEGAIVHSNIPLEFEKLEEEFPAMRVNDQEEMKRLVKLSNRPETWCRASGTFDDDGSEMIVSDVITGGSEDACNLVVIDEASLTFDVDKQGEKSEKDRLRPIFQLIALCRHVGLDIYFLAQDASNVNVKLRRLAATRTNCVNVKKLPFFGWVLRPLFGDFLRVTYSKNSTIPLGKQWTRFDPVVGASYRTHGMASSVGMRLMPTRKGGASDRDAAKGKKRFLTFAVIALVLVVGGIWRAVNQYQTMTGTGEKDDAAEKSPAAAVPGQPAPAAKPSSGPMVPKSRGGLIEVEWDAADEFVIASIWRKRDGLRIGTRNGPSLCVGADYMGERLESMVHHRGYYYFIGEMGRIIVARPAHPWERVQWREEALAGRAKNEEPKGLLDIVKEQL